MKHPLKAALLLSAGAIIGLSPQLVLASDAQAGDALSSWRNPVSSNEGLRLSMAMDFGASAARASGLNFTLRYGEDRAEPGRWNPPALFSARREAGQWQSLKLSGVEVLNLQQRLQAQGEDSNYAGWIIGGLVGIGAIAIIARELSNDDQKSFDINGANSDNR